MKEYGHQENWLLRTVKLNWSLYAGETGWCCRSVCVVRGLNLAYLEGRKGSGGRVGKSWSGAMVSRGFRTERSGATLLLLVVTTIFLWLVRLLFLWKHCRSTSVPRQAPPFFFCVVVACGVVAAMMRSSSRGVGSAYISIHCPYRARHRSCLLRYMVLFFLSFSRSYWGAKNWEAAARGTVCVRKVYCCIFWSKEKKIGVRNLARRMVRKERKEDKSKDRLAAGKFALLFA